MKQPSSDLPHLRIVSIAGLHPHEHSDQQRAEPLKKALWQDGFLKNPPIVLPVRGTEDDYVVLDGANRVTALQMLEIPHALVQVAHPNGDEVNVKTWNHVLLEVAPDALVTTFRSLNGFHLRSSPFETAQTALERGDSLVNVMVPTGEVYQTEGHSDGLEVRIRALDEFVGAYRDKVAFERTSAGRLDGLLDVYPDISCLVIFPAFKVSEVVEGAAEGWHFPPGITRFIVSPRALRLNYPLELLASEASLEEKQAELEAWIRERKRNRRVRYYAESTFLFDE